MAAQMPARNKNWRLLTLLTLLALLNAPAAVPGKGTNNWGSFKGAKIPK